MARKNQEIENRKMGVDVGLNLSFGKEEESCFLMVCSFFLLRVGRISMLKLFAKAMVRYSLVAVNKANWQCY